MICIRWFAIYRSFAIVFLLLKTHINFRVTYDKYVPIRAKTPTRTLLHLLDKLCITGYSSVLYRRHTQQPLYNISEKESVYDNFFICNETTNANDRSIANETNEVLPND